jgi:hypothetical protein
MLRSIIEMNGRGTLPAIEAVEQWYPCFNLITQTYIMCIQLNMCHLDTCNTPRAALQK